MFGFGISALMFMMSGIVVVFSPPDKSILAYAFAGVLIIAAAGVAGFTTVKMRGLGLTVGQGDGESQMVARAQRARKS
jgi:hypothetical protein